MGFLCHFVQQNMTFLCHFFGKICAENSKIWQNICDSEIQISWGYISGKTNGFKPFITG